MSKEIKFEDKLQRLEEIVKKMESGKLSLEENLELFQEGQRLGKELEETLQQAEAMVKEVIKVEE